MILVINKAKGPYKGRYDLPGGGVEFGESPADAVVREFLEETGMSVVVKEIVGAFSRVSKFVSDTGTQLVELHHMGFLYQVAQAEPGSPLKTDPDGLDSLGAVWLPLTDAHPDLISPLVAEGLRYITVQG
jgi:ADP-ribose pyrophosphatase YjhB (NUDIX family)